MRIFLRDCRCWYDTKTPRKGTGGGSCSSSTRRLLLSSLSLPFRSNFPINNVAAKSQSSINSTNGASVPAPLLAATISSQVNKVWRFSNFNGWAVREKAAKVLPPAVVAAVSRGQSGTIKTGNDGSRSIGPSSSSKVASYNSNGALCNSSNKL